MSRGFRPDPPAESATAPPPGIGWALFSFRGRMGRRSFFWASLLPIITFGLALAGVLAETNPITDEIESGFGIAMAFVLLAVLFIAPWIYAALAVKRLKDMDLPWPLVFVALVPFVALPAYAALCLIDGTDGPNKSGPRRNSRPWDK
ncbi:MAG: DUF805 domain-containing protein [Pseudomonadota bacterium]